MKALVASQKACRTSRRTSDSHESTAERFCSESTQSVACRECRVFASALCSVLVYVAASERPLALARNCRLDGLTRLYDRYVTLKIIYHSGRLALPRSNRTARVCFIDVGGGRTEDDCRRGLKLPTVKRLYA